VTEKTPQRSAETLRARFPWASIHALDYPIRYEELEQLLDELRAAASERAEPRRPGIELPDLVGDSEATREIRATIERVAPTAATVLISGESGTGKEVVARRIHALSGRAGPFVAINCSAIPDNLLESELFGHEKGSFTGAVTARAGKFELAAGGTIFLDEIGDMPLAMQVKLLRVLQERVVERVGSDRSSPIDVRVLAATHRDLPSRIEAGEFREDLYYRLSVFPVDVPPLRERPEDVRPLVHEMLRRVRDTNGVSVTLPEESMALLEAYAWPGNVRELANVVERLAVQKPFGRVAPDDLPGVIRGEEDSMITPGIQLDSPSAGKAAVALGAAGLDVKAHLTDVERNLIESALREANGVVARAAELLGVGRTTLIEKMRRYDLHA